MDCRISRLRATRPAVPASSQVRVDKAVISLLPSLHAGCARRAAWLLRHGGLRPDPAAGGRRGGRRRGNARRMLIWLLTLTAWGGITALWDLRRRHISNAAVLAGAALVLLRWALWREPPLALLVFQAGIGLLALWWPWRRRLMGGGDVKLGAVLAAIDLQDFGWALAIALLGAALLGGLRSRQLSFLPRPPADGPRQGIPFAPLLLVPFLALRWWHV
ncbi:prepilin peptidase [Roseococcus sp.]|uniref:prepilin peptidase n=1 Tax=Roseococcus sp. TaxID=2109646 RepID=UPI003BAB9158